MGTYCKRMRSCFLTSLCISFFHDSIGNSIEPSFHCPWFYLCSFSLFSMTNCRKGCVACDEYAKKKAGLFTLFGYVSWGLTRKGMGSNRFAKGSEWRMTPRTGGEHFLPQLESWVLCSLRFTLASRNKAGEGPRVRAETIGSHFCLFSC